MKESKQQSSEIISSLKKIVWAAGIVVLGRILAKAIGYFYILVVARLGTEEYGLLNLGLSVVSLLSIIALFGFEAALLRYIPYYQAKNDKRRIRGVILSTFKICLILGLFLSFIMFIFSEQIAKYFFHNSDLAPILKIFSFMLLPSALAILLTCSFSAFQRVDYQVGIKEVGERGIRIIVLLLLLSFGFGVFGAAISYVISAFCIFFVSLYVMQKKVFPIFKTRIKPKYYTREIVSYSFPLLLSVILNFIISSANTLILGYFRIASEVGIFNAALPTASLVVTFPFAITALFIPIVTKFYSRGKKKQVNKMYNTVCRWIFLINFPLFLLMVLFSKPIIKILFGESYIIGASALSILAFGYLLYSLTYTNPQILFIIKKTKLYFFLTFFFALSNIIFNLVLIPRYGFNGAAIATSASYLIGSLLFIFFTYKYTRLQPFDLSYIKPLISALISASFVYFITRPFFKLIMPLYGLILMFLLFLLLYSGLLFLFGCFKEEDIEIMRIIAGKFNKRR